MQTVVEQTEVKPANYTFDSLLVADGRSKNKKAVPYQKTQDAEPVETPETSKIGRYVCCECGRSYWDSDESIAWDWSGGCVRLQRGQN